MSLYSYLVRLEDTLRSRQDIILDEMNVTLGAIGAIFEAELHFYDGSRLSIVEEVMSISYVDTERIRYKFHYQ